MESQHQRVLSGGWLISQLGRDSFDRAETSHSRDLPQAIGLPASVPSTVLAALVENGRYEDPYLRDESHEDPTRAVSSAVVVQN